jgi:hypothetical protein
MDSNGVILRRSFRAEIDLANEYDADVFLEAEECPPNLSNWLTWLRLIGPNGHRYIGGDRAALLLIGQLADWAYPS